MTTKSRILQTVHAGVEGPAAATRAISDKFGSGGRMATQSRSVLRHAFAAMIAKAILTAVFLIVNLVVPAMCRVVRISKRRPDGGTREVFEHAEQIVPQSGTKDKLAEIAAIS